MVRNGGGGYTQWSGDRDREGADEAKIPPTAPPRAPEAAEGGSGWGGGEEAITHRDAVPAAMVGAETTAGSGGAPGGVWVQQLGSQRNLPAQLGWS